MHGFVTSPPILTQPQADGHAATEQRRRSRGGAGREEADSKSTGIHRFVPGWRA